MMTKIVRIGAISMLVICAVLFFPAGAWSESCSAVTRVAPGSCTTEGAKCSTAPEAGKPALQGACKTVSRAESKSACACADARGDVRVAGKRSLALRAKGGGAGAVALATFLVLVGLWSLIAVLRSRRTPSA
jgi:hypothetical protein